jgi:hypothetical protein
LDTASKVSSLEHSVTVLRSGHGCEAGPKISVTRLLVKHWLIKVNEDSTGKISSGGEEIVSEKETRSSHEQGALLAKEREVKAGKYV